MERFRKVVAGVLLLACVAGLVLTAYGIYRYRSYKRGIVEPLREDLVQRTRQAALRIETSLQPAQQAVEGLAGRLEERELTGEQELQGLLRRMLESDASYYGGAVAYEPFAFDPERRLYAPYFAKKKGGLTFLRIEEQYDYTEAQWEWYGEALARGPRWTEPYFDTSVGDILMTTYSAPFSGPDPESGAAVPRGIVTVDLSMDAIRDIVRSVDLGGMGYAVLLSRQGKFLYHPDPETVFSGVGLLEFASRSGDQVLTSLAERILEGGSGVGDHTAPLTGLDSWFVYEPVPATGWSLVTVFVKDDIPLETTVLRRWRLVAGSSLVIFLLSGLAFALRIVEGEKRRLWIASVLSTLILLAGIGFTWQVSLEYETGEGPPGRIANDIAGLEAFMDTSVRQARERLTQEPLFLSTGIFIDSLRFVSRTDIDLGGYVWQTFDPELHAGVDRGFLLAGVAGLDIGEPQTETVFGKEVLRWPFQAASRVRLNYSKFPLMRERIPLQLLPRELSRSIVLVPDLDAYEILSPAARPGLRQSVYLPGWDVTRTFFELRDTAVGTNFGLGGFSSRERFPSLFFNIEIRKDFVDTFVSHLVPMIIVGLVVFLVLMILNQDEKRVALMRTGTGFNLSICATLLFVTVFSHIGARQKIAAQEIVYLEYFYIVMYFAILWVAVNAIVLVLRPGFFFTRYEENLLPRVLFWPMTLGALWILTLHTFW